MSAAASRDLRSRSASAASARTGFRRWSLPGSESALSRSSRRRSRASLLASLPNRRWSARSRSCRSPGDVSRRPSQPSPVRSGGTGGRRRPRRQPESLSALRLLIFELISAGAQFTTARPMTGASTGVSRCPSRLCLVRKVTLLHGSAGLSVLGWVAKRTILRSVSGISRVAGLGCSLPKPLRSANLAEQSPRWEGATPHPQPPEMSAVPFKANADRRHHIPKQQDRVTNWSEYDAALRQRGSLTVWFTEEAIAAWRADPRTTRGGQPHYSALAITTALTLRAVFRLALRQTEGLIGSVIRLLGLDLAIPDHSTLSRRAETLRVQRQRLSSEPMHLIVDSTGLKLSGAGEWSIEKHGTSRRRSWRKLHIGVDADTGRIVAAALTTNDVDDGSQVGPLLDQIDDPIASLTGDGAYDQGGVYDEVAARPPDAAVIVPPRSSGVPSETAENAPTPRDRHLLAIAEHGRMGWQKASGYNWRALVEADIGRWKRVIGHALRSQTNKRQASSGRSGNWCRRPEPYAGAGTPELRPHRMRPRGHGITASTG